MFILMYNLFVDASAQLIYGITTEFICFRSFKDSLSSALEIRVNFGS